MATKRTAKRQLANPFSPSKQTGKKGNDLIRYLNPADELNGLYAGQDLWLTTDMIAPDDDEFIYTWTIDGGEFKDLEATISKDRAFLEASSNEPTVCIETYTVKAEKPAIKVTLFVQPASRTIPPGSGERSFDLQKPSVADMKGDFDRKIDTLTDTIKNDVSVSLRRSAVPATDDLALWVVIRHSTKAVGFNNYNNFMNAVLGGGGSESSVLATPAGRFTVPASKVSELPLWQKTYKTLQARRSLPFNDTDAYRLLKIATEAFLLVNSATSLVDFQFSEQDARILNTRLGSGSLDAGDMDDFWSRYLSEVNGTTDPMLPYLTAIRSKLRNEDLKSIGLFDDLHLDDAALNQGKYINVLQRKMMNPFLLELIHSYWLEEGMLVQTMNAITRRFQNVRNPDSGRDPLAGFEVDTLRPLSNMLWGYVQDEQHRLGIARRCYEYDHHYGISLQGKAVPKLRPADSRSKFIEGFHHLLKLCSIFFKQDDDTTVIADGFPILNALKEVHLILSQGAHNQFGDLPSTARQEMLLQQWLLARPEFREFLPTRIAVAYPEPWMDRVEAMKSLQGWTDTSVTHFRNLAVFGEQILLGIRYGNWSDIDNASQATNWARYWRSEIQGYIHAYRAVTGVDLSSSVMAAEQVDSTPPSVHIYNRYLAQTRRQ